MTLDIGQHDPYRVTFLGMGDTQANANLREFIDRDFGKVVASVALASGDSDAAEDGVQDALVKYLRDGHEPSNLAAWVTVVATNEVRQRMRRAGIERRAIERIPQLESQPVDSIAIAADIRAAVAELPERQCEIVLLHYYLDTSVADIATAMGITQGTVKTQLHRARATLADSPAIREEGAS